MVKICGIVFCYNEEHIIEECLKHYLCQGIDLVVFDNESTDQSPELVRKIQSQKNDFPGKILEKRIVKTEGYEWRKILALAEDYIKKNLSNYDWILLIDADAFYYSPIRGLSLNEFLHLAQKKGYNIINGTLCEFYPTEKDNNLIISPLERIKYCKIYYPDPQHKMLRFHESLEFSKSAGHSCKRDNPKICPVNFWYNHYKWVSYEHGLKKVFKERLPRFVEQRIKTKWRHPQYSGVQPRKEDFVKQSKNLLLHNQKSLLISKTKFLLSVYLDFFGIRFLQKIKSWLRSFFRKLVPKEITLLREVYEYDKEMFWSLLRKKFRNFLRLQKRDKKNQFKLNEEVDFQLIKLNEAIAQPVSVWGLPYNFYFTFSFSDKKSCSAVENHHKILSNIPSIAEPCLITFELGPRTKIDLDDFIEVVCQTRKKFSSAKLEIKFDITTLSFVACLSNKISFSRVVLVLNEESLQEIEKEVKNLKQISLLYIEFIPSSSSLRNLSKTTSTLSSFEFEEIEMLPDNLIKKNEGEDEYLKMAYTLKNFCKALHKKPHFKLLSFSLSKKSLKLQPWTTIVVTDSGTVYPWINSQDLLGEKIESGAYNFGNLLNEHLTDLWNCPDYGALRRTCRKGESAVFIPESKYFLT